MQHAAMQCKLLTSFSFAQLYCTGGEIIISIRVYTGSSWLLHASMSIQHIFTCATCCCMLQDFELKHCTYCSIHTYARGSVRATKCNPDDISCPAKSLTTNFALYKFHCLPAGCYRSKHTLLSRSQHRRSSVFLWSMCTCMHRDALALAFPSACNATIHP